MTHEEVQTLIDSYVDNELDAANALEVEKHLRSCGVCRTEEERIRTLAKVLTGAAPEYHAPKELKRNIRAALRREDRESSPTIGWALAAGFACVLLLAAIVLIPRIQTHAVTDEVVANHVRSMLGTHLVDIPTSDKHTVKPWFDGKVDFAPEVPDLAPNGFPLVGGRLDYLNGRTVAALVYQRNKHPINVFVAPAGNTRPSSPERVARRGYNVIHWGRGGLDYWAVSDLNAAELQDFVNRFRG